jgi:dipeptidase
MKKVMAVFLLLVAAFFMETQSVSACTILGVGTDATVDGSTIVTHNDDSTGADFRLWITPGQKWPEGSMRDLVIDSHNYGDFSKWPEVKDYGNGVVVAQIPQAKETYAYFHSRYSFLNEKGVSMGESTFNFDQSTDLRKKTYKLIFGSNTGMIDCWNAQDIALERSKTAREAVQVMGDLVEKYGWKDPGETMDICDGNEVWIAEFYGLDLWAAVRIPKNGFFVAANRARIDKIDFNDKENYMYSPSLKSFAVKNGLWSEASGVAFSPAEIYAPFEGAYSTRREWRAFDLVAPSLHLDPNATRFPLYVIPERKLSVQDIYEISGDYYQGTAYDVSLTPEAGPYGDAINPYFKERTINLFRSCYVMIANIKAWLPDTAKCLVWYGYGAADTSYLTPLWPTMKELPALYSTGSRYEEFRRDSGWWTNSYVQQTARINYQSAVKEIHAFRNPRMAEMYTIADGIQNTAASLIAKGKKSEAISLLSSFGYTTAVKWHDDWLKFGDELYGTYMWGYKDMKGQAPKGWWADVLQKAPVNPVPFK